MMSIKSITSLILLSVVIVFALAPLPADAFSFVPCGTSENQEPCQFRHIIIMIMRVLNYLIATSAIIAMVFILRNVFTLITAGGNPDSIKKGKDGILNTIVGFAIIVLAFVIINWIVGGIFGYDWIDSACTFGTGNGECL